MLDERPPSGKPYISLKAPRPLVERLRAISIANDRTLSAELRMALRRHLDAYGVLTDERLAEGEAFGPTTPGARTAGDESNLTA